MNDRDYTQALIGAVVRNNILGAGTIMGFSLTDKGILYVSILFDGTTVEKKYQARIAFEKKSLVFLNEELTELALNYVSDQEAAFCLQEKSIENDKKDENPLISELTRKVVSGKSIATDLIAVFDDFEFERELCHKAFEQLDRIMAGASCTKEHYACVICACALIGLKYYDGDFYSHLEKKYREYNPNSEYTREKIEKSIRVVARDFRDMVRYFVPKSHVAVPLVLACVPHYRVKDLFRIAYDIYKKKLLYDEEVTDGQIKEKVHETLMMLRRKELVSEADAIKGTNYLMSKYTQSCIFSGFGIGALENIITSCIRYIISHLSQPEDLFPVSPYYFDGYESWVKFHENDENEKNRYAVSKAFSQPFLRYSDDGIHVFTGKYSMDDSYDPNNIRVCIFNGDKLVVEDLLNGPNDIEYLDEDQVMGGYIINQKEFVITASPLDGLNYSICCGEKILYNSKNRLYRKVIFFDGKGFEIKPGNEYNGEVIVVSHTSLSEEYGDRCIEMLVGDGFFVSAVEVNNKNTFVFDNDPYVFHKIENAQLLSYEVPWSYFVSAEGRRYSILNDIVILAPASCLGEDLEIELDGNRYASGNEIVYSTRLFSKGQANYVYSIKVKQLEAGFHSLRVYNRVSGKLIKGASFSVVFDADFSRTFALKDVEGITYELVGGIIKTQTLLFEYGTPKKEIQTFVKNVGYGRLVLLPTAISYSVDGMEWRDLDQRIYMCNIPESIKTISICGPLNMAAYLVNQDATVKKQELSLVTDEDNQSMYFLHLSYLRSLNINMAKVAFEYGNRTKYVKVYYNPYVLRDECRFYYDEERGMHCFDIRFDGAAKAQVIIKPLHSDVGLYSKLISSGELIEIEDVNIDKSIEYLTIALYGKKYGALFEQYQKEPFYSFPKYDLGRKKKVSAPTSPNVVERAKPKAEVQMIPTGKVKLRPKRPEVRIENGCFMCDLSFTGTSEIIAELLVPGVRKPLFTKVIHKGERISFSLSGQPYKDFMLHLYYEQRTKDGTFRRMGLYNSPIIGIDTIDALTFKGKTFKVNAFKISNRTRLTAPFDIRFGSTFERKGNSYLTASLVNRITGSVLNDLLVKIVNPSGPYYEVSIRLVKQNKDYQLTYRDRVIVGAFLEKKELGNEKSN